MAAAPQMQMQSAPDMQVQIQMTCVPEMQMQAAPQMQMQMQFCEHMQMPILEVGEKTPTQVCMGGSEMSAGSKPAPFHSSILWGDASDDDEVTEPVTTMCGSATTASGLSNSQLRRRRRQRAAEREEVAKREQMTPQPEEQEEPDDEPTASELEAQRTRDLADGLLVQVRQAASSLDSSDVWDVQQYMKRLAFADKASSRAAQVALQESQGLQQSILASSLRGFTREALRSMFANYVIQEVVTELPAASTTWISQELRGYGNEVARHRFGCRILCRLMEHCSADSVDTIALLDEVFVDASMLLRHAYGTFVVRHGLEYGTMNQKRQITFSLWPDVYVNAGHQHASRVVEAALIYGADEDRYSLAMELTCNQEQVLTLAKGLSGRHVVKTLLRMPGWSHHVAEMLRPHAADLRASKYGRVVAELVESM
jgi:hypothetical protein